MAARALVSASAAWGVFWGGWGALLPAIKSRTAAGDGELGLALLGIAAGALPALALAGRLSDRVGAALLPWSLAAFALTLPLPGLARSPEALALSLVALGAASGCVDVALNAGTAALEAATGRRLFNAVHAAFPLAVVGAAPAAGVARSAGAEPPVVLVAMALLVAGAALVAARSGDAGAATVAARPRGASPAAAHGRPRPRRLPPVLLGLGLAAAAIHLVENAIEQWSAIHLEDTLGAGAVVASLGPAVYFAALFVGRVLAQLRGRRLEGPPLVALAGAAGAAGLALVALARAPTAALAGFALAGLGMAAGIPTLFALAGRRSEPARRGVAISAVTTSAYLGYLASPPLVGAVAGAAGLRAAWWALAALSGALAVAWLARRGDPVGSARR